MTDLIKNIKRISAGGVLVGAVSLGIGLNNKFTTDYSLPLAEQAVLDDLAERNSALDTKLQTLPRGIYPNTNLDNRLNQIVTLSDEIAQDTRAFQELYQSKEVQDAMAMRDKLNSQEMPYKVAAGAGGLAIAFGVISYFFLVNFEKMDARRREDFEKNHGIPLN